MMTTTFVSLGYHADTSQKREMVWSHRYTALVLLEVVWHRTLITLSTTVQVAANQNNCVLVLDAGIF